MMSAHAGHPPYVAVIDTGMFVLTDQRIVFVGVAGAVQMSLAKVIHVGPYSDALAVAAFAQQVVEEAEDYCGGEQDDVHRPVPARSISS